MAGNIAEVAELPFPLRTPPPVKTVRNNRVATGRNESETHRTVENPPLESRVNNPLRSVDPLHILRGENSPKTSIKTNTGRVNGL